MHQSGPKSDRHRERAEHVFNMVTMLNSFLNELTRIAWSEVPTGVLLLSDSMTQAFAINHFKKTTWHQAIFSYQQWVTNTIHAPGLRGGPYSAGRWTA